MTATMNPPPVHGEAGIFDDFEALTALVQDTFDVAVRKAVAENDRAGIPTPVGANIQFREPSSRLDHG